MKFSWVRKKNRRKAEAFAAEVELPANVVRMEEYLPHSVSELICVKCGHRWIGVYPSAMPLKDFRCAGCMETGGVILTGQPIEDDGDDDFYA